MKRLLLYYSQSTTMHADMEYSYLVTLNYSYTEAYMATYIAI